MDGKLGVNLMRENRGLNSTFLAPTAFFPLIGGIMLQYTSFVYLFILTALFILASFLLSFKLEESRKR